MNNWIVVQLTLDGQPLTGETGVVVSVIDLDTDALVVNAAAMTESILGFYKYNFTTRDHSKQYAIHIDAGTDNVDVRIHSGVNDKDLLFMGLFNRMEVNAVTGEIEFYNTAGDTLRLKATLADKSGSAITVPSGAIARRGSIQSP